MVRRMVLAAAFALPLVASDGLAQRSGPPHEWLFGSWTGGLFPALETEGPYCLAQPAVIFTRELVMRASLMDIAYRPRVVETAAGGPDSIEFRLSPVGGGRLPPDIGFGCDGNPNLLRVERRGPDEIVFPGCTDFPSPLRRCIAR